LRRAERTSRASLRGVEGHLGQLRHASGLPRRLSAAAIEP
jgi:hypothetical protein